MMDVDEIFEGGHVPRWFRAFAESPTDALAGLLIGCADLGSLAAAEPAVVLVGWLEAVGDRAGFAEAVDRTLAEWIRGAWGDPSLDVAAGSAPLTALAWCRAADVIAMEPCLEFAAATLREMVLQDRRFLDWLADGRSRDPLGRAWLALARHQHDRSLRDEWWRLCSIPPDEPWYRGEYGIHGLRGLPAEDPRDAGQFSDEVAAGLLRLGIGLARRSEQNWLDDSMARSEFQHTARLTMLAYPFKPEWYAFWSAAPRPPHGPPTVWVQSLVAAEMEMPSQDGTAPPRRRTPRPRPEWGERARGIAVRLGARDAHALDEARSLLAEQATYAERSGDTWNVVHSGCWFASQAERWAPGQALAWAEMARAFDPWNAHAWTICTKCLLRLGRTDEARQVGLRAVERFPQNVVARNGLADVLAKDGRLAEAEELYRETTVLFPNNDFARNGLADVLAKDGRVAGAEELYRETIKLFPNDVIARCGLADVLAKDGRLAEAEAEFEAALQIEPGDEFALRGLRHVQRLLAPGETRDETEFGDVNTQAAPEEGVGAGRPGEHPRRAETPAAELGPQPTQASRLTPQDVQVILADAAILRRWGRGLGEDGATPAVREEADRVLQCVLAAETRDPSLVAEVGLWLLDRDDLDRAIKLLTEAQRQAPGNARAAYALARARRELARRDAEPLSEMTEREVLGPWQDLVRMGGQYGPLRHLGMARGYHALRDGSTAEGAMREALGRLGRWVARRIEVAQDDEDGPLRVGPNRFRPVEGSDEFSAWWAAQVQTAVFGDHLVSSADGLQNLNEVLEHLDSQSDFLDDREAEFVFHYSPA